MITPVLCLLLATNDPSAAELTRSTHDLGSIIQRPISNRAVIRTLPLNPGPGDDDIFDSVESEPAGADQIVDLLYNTVSPEEWQYEGRHIQISGSEKHPRLVIDAPAPVQKEVARFLQYVDKALNRRVRVRVDVFHIAEVGPALMPLLGTSETKIAEELRSQLALELRESFELRVLSGEPAERSQLERRLYTRDFDVEIAQGAAVHQPVSEQYAIGTALALRSEIGTDNKALVSFAIHDAWELGGPRPIAAESYFMVSSEAGIDFTKGASNLESPSVHFATIAGSARLGVGQTTTVFAALPENSQDAAEGVLAMITVEYIDGEPGTFNSAGRELAIRTVAGDASTGFQSPRFNREALRFSYNGMMERDEDGVLPLNLVLSGNSDGADMIIDSAMDAAYGYAEDAGMQLGRFGGVAYAIGPTGKATEVLSRVLAGIPTIQSIPPAVAEMTIRRKAKAGVQAIPLFAVSGGTGDAFVAAGVQETYILSNDVDVANNSSICNPNVSAIVSGYVARVHGAPGFQGMQSLEVLLCSQLRQGDKGAFDTGSRQVTVLHHPRFVAAVLSSNDRVSSGDRLSLGAIPLPGEPPASGLIHLTIR